MKNLYLLPTDQPTGIFETNSGLQFSIMNKVRYGEFKGFHIYITSGVEIGESDWFIHHSHNTTSLHQAKSVVPERSIITTNDEGCWMINSKKIILSTDTKIIEGGVQAIDNEFLEWFVKNSNCEFVEVDKIPDLQSYNEKTYKCELVYTITIPQEEPKISDLPKTETLEEQRMYSEEEVYELLCQFFDDHVNAKDANIAQWFEQNKKK